MAESCHKRLDKELGTNATRRLVRLIEDGFFLRAENTTVSSLTVSDYFQYCKIAYIAGKRKEETVDKSLSGQEMYSRYADGRHEGLMDIDPTSEQEFADWVDGKHPKRNQGGHPWEIKRGGNTTHIDLTVLRQSLYQHFSQDKDVIDVMHYDNSFHHMGSVTYPKAKRLLSIIL